jgi:hypothetical protein
MSSLPRLQATLSGRNLLCHNGQTADPLNRFSKAMKVISSKRKKVDADYDQMSRIEWTAGLYMSGGRFILPDYVIESSVIGGAKKSKNGVQAKCGIFFDEDAPLTFDGCPEGQIDQAVLDEMFDSGDFVHKVGVKVGMSKVMRTRPIFRNWQAVVDFAYDPDVLDLRAIREILHDAGRLVGIGDWRPKYGRYSVELVEV